MGLLAPAMHGLLAGTAYAVWTGLGAVGVIIGGLVFFGDRVGCSRKADRRYGLLIGL